MNTKNMYSQLKSCIFLVCFTIMNRVSYFQIVIRRINKKYKISSLVPGFLKHRKTTPQQDDNFYINSDLKLIPKNIDEITYYKLINKNSDSHEMKPCKYIFTSINLIDVTSENEKDYVINITDNDFNYFCIDNIIDSNFLTWYLQKYHKSILPENYKLSIIDHECEMIDVEKDKLISLEEDTYTIV